METIYCISGLGADKSIFQNLKFPENYNIIYLEWLTPIKDESLEDYSKRLLTKITDKFPIIIGLSFGGIVAQYIALHISCKKLILISSTTSAKNIPSIRKLFRILPFHKLVPENLFSKTNFLVYYMFSIKSFSGKYLLKQIFINSDLVFVRWAIQKIIDIESIPKVDCPVFQVHGIDDKLFPVKLKYPEFILNNAGHFMVYENAEEVSKIINLILEKNN